jgi:alkaline phosphatase D
VTSLSRRNLLAAGAALAVAPAQRLCAVTGGVFARRNGFVSSGSIGGNPFALGVSSGDPDETSAVLWTRLTAPDGSTLDAGDVEITWELADDREFESSVTWGTAVARADEAHSVHAVVEIDSPRWFRFRAGEWTSPAGRVAPTGLGVGGGDGTNLRVATASCQHYEAGHYGAHRDLAEWAPDLVVFLGDFIYEYASSNISDDPAVRSHGSGEAATLDDYRRRYALYLSDADLRAARAACPWLVVWDDHEVENNYAGLTSETAGPPEEFAVRRLAAYQAWWEHMPVRVPRPTGDGDTMIYRTVRWGSLADVILLDGRQFRTDQACGDVTLSVDPACPETFDPARTMLGGEQERWVGEQFATSSATWPVLAQQTVLSDITLPNSAVLNFDQWDGYPKARERLLLQAAQAPRTIVLTGDIHLAGIGRLPGVGVEFVTSSVSSPSLVPPDLVAALTGFESIVDAELSSRGYTRHTVTPDEWTAEYRIVADSADPASPVSTWKTFTVAADRRDTVVEREP